jgi:calcium-translocating P-type ATPase
MSAGTPAAPYLLHAIPGRIRVHLPAWSGGGRLQVEQHIRHLPGVRRVEANPLTGNILIGFDPSGTDAKSLLAALGTADYASAQLPEDKPLPPVVQENGPGAIKQARIAVRGLDRDPGVARTVVERLRQRFGVRARANMLTGRVLVEYDERRVDLHELLARVAEVELPDLPGEDRPAHPLDLGPLLHAATRSIGAGLGLSLIAARRLAGWTVPPGRAKTAATAAGILGLLRSFPLIRNGLRRLLGPHAADLVFSTASVVTLAFSGSPLGLTLTGLEGLLLLTEVRGRRAAWRRHEDRLQGAVAAEPGAVIRLEAGERVPLEAEVIEGTGTAIGRDGLPRRIVPGVTVSAGADLSGGPFVLHLHGGKPFLPQPRPAPLAPNLYTRYLHALGPLSLGYAALTTGFTRSLGRTFEALLLVNPRPAIIGMEAAQLDAAARVLRGGVTVVGTRPDRTIALPDVLLLDGPRVLVDGLEIAAVLPLEEGLDDAQVLVLAWAVAGAAGAPWGSVFPRAGNVAAGGTFNGLWAAAAVEGVRYVLGPPEDPPALGEAVERRHQGGYLLMLAREDDERALGLVALRPRARPGAGPLPADGRGPAGELEITTVLPLEEGLDDAQVLALAGGIAAAAGSPWGSIFRRADNAPATAGTFNGLWAAAAVAGVRYTLGPPEDPPVIGEAVQLRHQGGYLLVLSREDDWRPLGFVALRPRLSPAATRLVQACRRLGVRLEMLAAGAPEAAQAVARRAEVALVASTDAVAVIGARQQAGARVLFVSDSAQAAPAFAACDLALGLTPGPTGDFPARADLLAPDLDGVVAVLEAGARHNRTVRDAVVLSAAANMFGAVWGFRGRPGVERASHGVYVGALTALADGWLRLRGGKRPGSSLSQLVDPRPERWGRHSVASVLSALKTSEAGLSSAEAAQRCRAVPPAAESHPILTAILDQVRAPVNGILAGGAILSLIAGGAALDIVIIAATVAVNVVVGVWQERQAGKAVEALHRLGTARARVLRNGALVTLPATAVVPGDILLLAPGDRVAADARLLSVQNLEVDEAALTGESVPVPKQVEGSVPESRMILEGSGVVVGTGRAVVVGVGRQTRLGAIAAALSLEDTEDSPFGARLARLLHLALPIAAVGGATVIVSGLVWRKPLLSQLAVGASIALAVVPESLPLLAGTGQVGVARRLAGRRALLRRLSAVEALGRVDVACTDKTGTLTEGRLAVRLIASADHEASWPGPLEAELSQVLLTAALASPHPEAVDAAAHPTDIAVLTAARAAGLGSALQQVHGAEAPFESDRSFHAAVVRDRLCVKGAPEALSARCTHIRRAGKADQPLDNAGRQALLDQAQHFAARGLRTLLVAEGPPNTPVGDPQGLRALGFVGIADPLRPTVPAAVARCHAAGVRVLMITGDHPATARAIAREAGLANGDGDLLSGDELTELADEDIDRRLERATVIARATPLDKLRIIASLRRRGHTVAMTGDGVNDAPALRLADVGVAMGRGGTEVARQAADLVLADDDFATLVEALVEGRGFWRNMRRALGLLLGGNAGELGLIVGASVLGFTSPLNTRQILVVNLITDALPALSVALQQPEHRNLAGLAREGASALDASLRRDVLRRGAATAIPALAAFLLAQRSGSVEQASSVAFGTVVATQLAQTLDAGWTEGSLNRSVLGAVAGSTGLLAATLTVGGLRDLLGLGRSTPLAWGLIGTGAMAAVALSRLWTATDVAGLARLASRRAAGGAAVGMA